MMCFGTSCQMSHRNIFLTVLLLFWGPNIKTAVAILNCLIARQLCFEDASCSAILEIIPRVCGPELVACSTVTVTKCQAALRTLQAFPFFKPTCLCREPHVEPECNSFRDFLFDHPCIFVLKKEKDPYPVDALPTCNHALSVCQGERKCIKLFEDFKSNCKVRDGKCKMDDRDMCHDAWTKLRLSPMFGCICPNNHMKRRCDRIFSMVNHNPCVGSEPENELPKNFSYQSTCHLALDICNNNYSCRMSLQPVLHHCDQSQCNREACMEALQNFYRNAELKWSLEIAFCLCRKTENKQDECLVSQEKLHPVCAQRVEGTALPTCHSLAEFCREELTCRNRLEYYEQSCAVDSVTKKCAGPPGECRKAMLGILGTELRANCACKGTDFTQLYDCLGWQRLLWVNPCVVESQKDFHAKRAAENMPLTATAGPTIITLPAQRFTDSSSLVEKTTSTAATSSVDNGHKSTDMAIVPSTPSTTTTTTIPPRFCVVQRPYQSDQYIREGRGKRLYREDEPECSELCQCSEGETLVCNTVCVERAPCQTEFAFYNHKAPAYQAYRGRCLCYSGRFICMRPSPESYNLPLGVFLFLGYSETDEALLKNHSNMTVQDAVSSLQEIMHHEVTNKTSCSLTLYNVTKENLIVMAKLSSEILRAHNKGKGHHSSLELLTKEKEECVAPLQDISEKINTHHPEFHSHLLLSIFKMAEVEVKVPSKSSGSPANPQPSLVLLLSGLVASSLVLFFQHRLMKSPPVS